MKVETMGKGTIVKATKPLRMDLEFPIRAGETGTVLRVRGPKSTDGEFEALVKWKGRRGPISVPQSGLEICSHRIDYNLLAESAEIRISFQEVQRILGNDHPLISYSPEYDKLRKSLGIEVHVPLHALCGGPFLILRKEGTNK